MKQEKKATRQSYGEALVELGKQNKKIVVVKGYTKSNGTKVNGHRRSTPN